MFWLEVFVFQYEDDTRNAYAKIIPKKSQWKEIVDYFYRGSKYEWLEGQEGRRFAAIKNNFENRRKELERVAESEIVLHRHIFISITGRGIKENIEK